MPECFRRFFNFPHTDLLKSFYRWLFIVWHCGQKRGPWDTRSSKSLGFIWRPSAGQRLWRLRMCWEEWALSNRGHGVLQTDVHICVSACTRHTHTGNVHVCARTYKWIQYVRYVALLLTFGLLGLQTIERVVLKISLCDHGFVNISLHL